MGELGEGGVLVEGSKSAFLLRCVVRYDTRSEATVVGADVILPERRVAGRHTGMVSTCQYLREVVWTHLLCSDSIELEPGVLSY